MKYIDAHCHLHDPRIVNDISGIVRRAQVAGVRYMVSCATMEENFEITAKLSQRFTSVIPGFGLHPWFIHLRSAAWKQNLTSYLESVPSVIGETGLDFTDKTWDRQDQTRVFEYHLGLAREMERPINIHLRNAWDAFIHIIKKIGKLPVPGMIHSYSGAADMIGIFEKYNLYISFSGSATNPKAKKVVNALKKVDKERFVIETDSPDIYPYIGQPGKGKLNAPKNLPAIAKIAAQRMGIGQERFAAQAYANAKQLFGNVLASASDKEN